MRRYMIFCITLMICMMSVVGCGKEAESGEEAVFGQTAEAGDLEEASVSGGQPVSGQLGTGGVSVRDSDEGAESGGLASGKTGGVSEEEPERKAGTEGDGAFGTDGDAGTGGKVGGVSGEGNPVPAGSSDREEGAGGNGVSGALSVSGTQLVDAAGNPVQLRGISTHGLAWYPEYVNAECFRQFQEEWGMNVIRLAMYTGESGGYCTGGNQEELKALVKNGVEYATDCGMYVIIDWHILSDGNPNTYLEEAEAFFGEMAETYAEYTNVLYEICNEPNGGTSWSDVKIYAEQVIEVIREKDKDGIILVGTPNWCQYVEQAAADPVTGYENIMYTLHFYAATHTDGLRDALVKAVEAGLPVFVSEYGICDASGSGAIDAYQADRWMELLDEYGISSVAWNLSNKSETSAILKSSCGKVSGFTQEDLSDSGKWLYERMGSYGGKAEGAGAQSGEAGNAGSAGSAGTGNAGGAEAGSVEAGNAGGAGAGSVEAGNAGGAGAGSVEAGNAGSTSAGQTASGSSGAAVGNTIVSDGLNITAKVVNSWGQGSDTYFQYELAVSNPGETARDTWKIRLTFSCDISLENGWNGTYEAEGNTLTISSMDYNGYIDKSGSVENVGFIIRAEEGCLLE